MTAATPALDALVLDWGGVLTDSLDAAMADWARRDGIDFAHFREVMRQWVTGRRTSSGEDLGPEPVAVLEQADDDGPAGISPVHLVERGELTGAQFEAELATELSRRGSVVQAEGLLDRMLAGVSSHLLDDMVGMIRRARAAGVKTALLSNSWGDGHYPEALWDNLFDVVVISGKVGMRKPEPEIFIHTLDRLGLPAGRCVMVDDLAHNVRASVAVGMVGVLHTSYETTVTELEALFEIPLR